jgi:hypothetical protein
VSQNAITHGIFANTPLLPNENADEFAALSKGIKAIYPPVDAIAEGLTERIILAMWRQKRLRIAETAKINISMTPEIMAEEISDALRLPYNRRLNAKNISDEQEEDFNYWKTVAEEFNQINITAAPGKLTELSTKAPHIYRHLKQDALESVITYEIFMKTPDKIIASLEKTKKYANDFLSNNSLNHTAHQISEQMKLAKLVPDSASLDFLNKYQFQLDTDLYRAIDAYKKHCAWRVENLEIEVAEEVAA